MTGAMTRDELRALQAPIKDRYTGPSPARGTCCCRPWLRFEVESDASDEELDTLMRLTERYCVVLQTLAGNPALSTSLSRS